VKSGASYAVVTDIKITNFNVERCGWQKSERRHDLAKVVSQLADSADVDGAPDVLMLTECTHLLRFAQAPLWELVGRLNSLLPNNQVYYPFMSTKEGSTNPPGLFVNSATVSPIEWYVPGDDWTSATNDNWLLARIGGIEVWINSLHWDGSQGPEHFLTQSSRLANMAGRSVLVAGDFNATSSAPGEAIPADWVDRNQATPWKLTQKSHLPVPRRLGGTWEVHTEPIDRVLEAGFVDAGQQAEDFTVTVNDGIDNGLEMRIDRILASRRLLERASFVDGTYRVVIPEPDKQISDHREVSVRMAIGN